MSDSDQRDDDDGIRTEDLGYGKAANPQHAGGIGAALPGSAVPTGTGEVVTDDGTSGSLSELPEGNQTPQTKAGTATSGGSPAAGGGGSPSVSDTGTDQADQ